MHFLYRIKELNITLYNLLIALKIVNYSNSFAQSHTAMLYHTSLNPQNLRNIIKKVAKISIIQILMSNLSVKTTVFCFFLQLLRYLTNFARLR